MSGSDWLIILLYFGLLLGLTWWAVRMNKDTADDYFLASRNLGWLIVGSSIFASNIGSEHLVGLAGAGATSGVALAHYELHAWCLLVLGWVFVPFYSRSLVYTMPEFLERRFSPAARWVLSIISLPRTVWLVGSNPRGTAFAASPSPSGSASIRFTWDGIRSEAPRPAGPQGDALRARAADVQVSGLLPRRRGHPAPAV